MIHFMSTDIHNLNNIKYLHSTTTLKELKKLVSVNLINDITAFNISKVIHNEEIIPYEIIPQKKFFSFLKWTLNSSFLK